MRNHLINNVIILNCCGLTSYDYSLNPIKLNRISQSYQMDQFISVLRAVGWYFSFYSNFNRKFCKQTVESGSAVFVYVPQRGAMLKWVDYVKNNVVMDSFLVAGQPV